MSDDEQRPERPATGADAEDTDGQAAGGAHVQGADPGRDEEQSGLTGESTGARSRKNSGGPDTGSSDVQGTVSSGVQGTVSSGVQGTVSSGVQGTEDRAYRQELSESERDLLRRIDPGAKALTIAGVMLVLVVCSILPWIDSATGWQVLFGETDPALKVNLLPRLFALNSTIAGVLLSALALATRRWALAWVAGMACVVVTFEGITAIWSRQTVPEGGPAVGLVLAALCMLVLAVQWMRIVLTRP